MYRIVYLVSKVICAINGRRGILKRKDAAPPVP